MANALKLTESQTAALRLLVAGTNPFTKRGRSRPNCGTITVLRSLERRGLVRAPAGSIWDVTITQAGRAALFTATVTVPEAIREGELPTMLYVCPGCRRADCPSRVVDEDRICVDCERTMVRYQHAEAP